MCARAGPQPEPFCSACATILFWGGWEGGLDEGGVWQVQLSLVPGIGCPQAESGVRLMGEGPKMSVLDKTNVDMETALLNDKGASVPRTPDFSQPERSGSVFRCGEGGRDGCDSFLLPVPCPSAPLNTCVMGGCADGFLRPQGATSHTDLSGGSRGQGARLPGLAWKLEALGGR